MSNYLKDIKKISNLVTKNRVSRNRKTITRGACHAADGSKHRGHDQNNLNCPQKTDCTEEKIVKERVRDERKINIAKKLHKATFERSLASLTLGQVLYQVRVD